ncbi:hypothetical protein CDAR_200511 [Caerostris darwini]|uniref:Uncharacterized protein n=1 Tax=Caerostris darwini TaxID=1538125 RepID=A0AAV4TV78_9ARAC|nr:hypothetical protein CDAR_200511 [Caerostris darwini]
MPKRTKRKCFILSNHGLMNHKGAKLPLSSLLQTSSQLAKLYTLGQSPCCNTMLSIELAIAETPFQRQDSCQNSFHFLPCTATTRGDNERAVNSTRNPPPVTGIDYGASPSCHPSAFCSSESIMDGIH